jgi:hypothetical protein
MVDPHGNWTVLSEVKKESDPDHDYYRCQCKCGAIRVVQGSKLRAGRWETCGCTFKTHGLEPWQKSLAAIWNGIIQRCTNPNCAAWPYYGARGIRVCERWADSFADFTTDIGPRPNSEASLDRIDNNGHYEPGNVRWASHDEQARNRRNNRVIAVGGREMCLSDWAAELGCSAVVIAQRLNAGWSEEVAVTMPVAKRTPRKGVASPAGPIKWRAGSVLTANGTSRSLKEWARIIGCRVETIIARLGNGWAHEEAVNTPVATYRLSNATPA